MLHSMQRLRGHRAKSNAISELRIVVQSISPMILHEDMPRIKANSTGNANSLRANSKPALGPQTCGGRDCLHLRLVLRSLRLRRRR